MDVGSIGSSGGCVVGSEGEVVGALRLRGVTISIYCVCHCGCEDP